MENLDAGLPARILSAFPCTPRVGVDQMAENARSALARGLPEAGMFRAHDRTLSVAAGGPSLADTWQDFKGDVAAVNGSLRFLLERDVVPWACGVLDPGDHMADLIERKPGVFYFVASICHPSVFDKLSGCDVIIWHPSPMPIECPRLQICGGCTMGLRWVTLGYAMGFRKFDLHGLDSSFRGMATHAYPDRRDGEAPGLVVNGRATAINFVQQIADFFEMVELFRSDDLDDIALNVRGDGLLQDFWRAHCRVS